MKLTKRNRLLLTAVVLTMLSSTYVGGYALTFWLCGSGKIGPYQAIAIEGTAFLPLQLWRLSNLPGAELISEFREHWFELGLRSYDDV